MLDKLWLWRGIEMLIMDAGNSRVKFAVFKEDKIVRRLFCDTKECLDIDYLRSQILSISSGDALAFSSVIPEITREVMSLSHAEGIECFNVSYASEKILKIDYNIEQLGGDRLASAVAGYRKYGTPLLVVDFGTATTYNIILPNAIFAGGIIAPGIKSSIDFLINRTGLLPEIPLEYPETFPGHNSKQALTGGFFYTFSGQMKEISQKVRDFIDGDYKTIGTGGLLDFALSEFPDIIPDKDLTFLGIKLLYEANG
jgi:type III pantothenate kinase